jgi:hypothetical protein
MNTRNQKIQKYAVISLALLMALVGLRTLGARAADMFIDNSYPEDIPDSNQPEIDPEPTADDLIDPEPTPIQSDDNAIREALAKYFGMDVSEFYHFEIKDNTGMHARGGVDNGYFLVAKVAGQWIFVDGGHRAPNCNDVAELGFPASMVPECAAAESTKPDCEDVGTTVATFIKDVTIEDGSTLDPGQYFIKTWRIQNVGTCTWNSDYQLVFASGDLMGGSLYQSLTNVHIPPGTTMDVSVQLRAPEESGSYRGYWRFKDSQGGDFGLTSGGSVWVDIKVEDDSSSQNNSDEDYTGYPLIEILDVDEDQSVTIKVKNLPPQDLFNVEMNFFGTEGINGEKVGSFLTDDGGKLTATFEIPDFLKGQSAIAIRLKSPYSGYYSYNWFYNS